MPPDPLPGLLAYTSLTSPPPPPCLSRPGWLLFPDGSAPLPKAPAQGQHPLPPTGVNPQEHHSRDPSLPQPPPTAAPPLPGGGYTCVAAGDDVGGGTPLVAGTAGGCLAVVDVERGEIGGAWECSPRAQVGVWEPGCRFIHSLDGLCGCEPCDQGGGFSLECQLGTAGVCRRVAGLCLSRPQTCCGPRPLPDKHEQEAGREVSPGCAPPRAPLRFPIPIP